MRCRAPQALPLGLLLTIVGVGALVGALAVASLPERARRGRWLTAGNLAFPVLLLAFSLRVHLWYRWRCCSASESAS